MCAKPITSTNGYSKCFVFYSEHTIESSYHVTIPIQ